MKARPLRVAVTRDEPADGPLGVALRRAGLVPIACPVVREGPPPDPGPLADAAAQLERYDWLVVASARAVAALHGARHGARLPGHVRTAAVGQRTATALTACGAIAPLRAAREGAEWLAGALREADDWPARRVLLPRAFGGGSVLVDALASYGATVSDVIAYRTEPRDAKAIRASWRAVPVDAAVFASPSAAEALIRAVGADAVARLDFVIAIGPTTAAALAAYDVAATVPSRADFDSIAELLAGCTSAHTEKPRS
jgi:uroporphyrinogen-III synthase